MTKLNVLPIMKNSQSVVLSNGTVVRREEDLYHLLTESGAVVEAQKADGCLLDPEAGDLVLVSHGGRAGGFILCVLVKEGDDSQLTVKGRARLNADQFTLSGRRKVSIEAPEVRQEGVKGALNFIGMTLQTSDLRADAQNAEIKAGRLNVTLDRLTQRMRNCFRWVENLDQIKAGRISRIVKERFLVKSRHASIRAEAEVSVDAEKIHLG